MASSSKDQFEQQLQQWAQLDTVLKAHQEKIKDLRDRRQQLETTILQYAAEQHLPQAVLPGGGGRLRFATTNAYEPITFRFLETSLAKIIRNPDQVKSIVEHLKRDRKQTQSTEIRRLA